MDDLSKQVERKLISYDIDSLPSFGLHKKKFLGWTDSQIVVTYPIKSNLSTITADEIFSNPNSKEFALYFHIPFCTGRCSYCGFTSFLNQAKCIEPYIDALETEVMLYKEYDQVQNAKISSIYVGGGYTNVYPK